MRFFLKVLWLAEIFAECLGQGGYQYHSFSGPVSGIVREISVPRTNLKSYNPFYNNQKDLSFDYVAKPDYSFIYGVDDPDTGNSQKHEETRDGDLVRGEYSFVEPDGSIRRVVYTADSENGFQATVHRIPPPKSQQSFPYYNDDYSYY